MLASDLAGFFADPATLDRDAHLLLDYRIECRGDPRLAVAHFCSEQSTAQWRRAGQDEDLRPRFAAKAIELRVLDEQSAFSYGVEAPGEGPIHVCRVRIAHPHDNFGPGLPNLLSAICGEGTFFSPGIPIVRLLDVEFPASYLRYFQGPAFGVAGLRRLLDVQDRPLFFGVIKPNLGLPPETFSALGYEGWLGGLDIAKDDEMLANPTWCPLDERTRYLGEARCHAEAAAGRPKIYLANITSEVDELVPLHDLAVRNGANAVLVNALPVGFSGVRMLRKHAEVPIVAHFPMLAALSRLPVFGIHARVLTKLQRLAGFDSVIMPGIGSRMMTSDEDVLACVQACLEPMGSILPCLPVPGGSDWAGTLGPLYERLGTVEFGFVPGRGVFGHPEGPRAGAMSLHQAWEGVRAGRTLHDQARSYPELRAAIAAFGMGDARPSEDGTDGMGDQQ